MDGIARPEQERRALPDARSEDHRPTALATPEIQLFTNFIGWFVMIASALQRLSSKWLIAVTWNGYTLSLRACASCTSFFVHSIAGTSMLCKGSDGSSAR